MADWTIAPLDDHTPAKRLGFGPKRSCECSTSWKLNLKVRPLGHCRPQGGNFRIAPQHGEKMSRGRPAVSLRRFCNQPIHVHANSRGCVFHVLRELKGSKALVRVFHFRLLQPSRPQPLNTPSSISL